MQAVRVFGLGMAARKKAREGESFPHKEGKIVFRGGRFGRRERKGRRVCGGDTFQLCSAKKLLRVAGRVVLNEKK